MSQRETTKYVRDDLPMDTRLALLEQAFGTMAEAFKWQTRTFVGFIGMIFVGLAVYLLTGGPN